MELLKGAVVSGKIKERVQNGLSRLSGPVPKLAVIRAGEKPDDITYERNAVKKVQDFGMAAETFSFPDDISDAEFKRAFREINEDGAVTGILVLLPLPEQIDTGWVCRTIDPCKDVDGISLVNTAKVFTGDASGFAPCTPEAVMEILRCYEIPLKGRRVTVVGRSKVVGKPLALLLLGADATVTVCHTKTVNLAEECKKAEILIAAAGRAKMIDRSFVAPGAVVIDVGINFDEEGKLCGDVDFGSVSRTASFLTPVPGGVGSVTTAVLGLHLLRAAEARA